MRLCCRFSKTKVADLQRICAFEFAYAKSRFTHGAACIKSVKLAQTKALISCGITQLICTFDFAYTKNRFSHDSAQIKSSYLAQTKALISCVTTVQSSDLHLCFNICKRRFSHETAHLKSVYLANTKVRFCSLFAYAKGLFSHGTASIKSVNLAETKAPISFANTVYLRLCLCKACFLIIWLL